MAPESAARPGQSRESATRPDRTRAAKTDARRAAKAILASLPSDEFKARSDAACRHAVTLAAEVAPAVALAFLSMKREIDTTVFLDGCAARGIRVAVPRMANDEIEFVELPADWRSWPLDAFGIPEPPAATPALPLRELAAGPTFALVPGLSFDARGGRLGRGKGFYDHFLSRVERERAALASAGTSVRAFTRAGFCLSVQMVDSVPADPHDAPVDFVVTEKGVMRV